jgi:predicted transcriptional regulator
LRREIMEKTVVEMAAEIVQVQAGQTRMTPDEIAQALNKTYEALKSLEAKEEEVPEEPRIERKEVEGKASIQRNKITCLECGKEFKQLSKSHLSSHGLTAKEYKEKHGIALGQALVSKDLSAKRRKVAKEKGLGKKLAKGRKKRAKA